VLYGRCQYIFYGETSQLHMPQWFPEDLWLVVSQCVKFQHRGALADQGWESYCSRGADISWCLTVLYFWSVLVACGRYNRNTWGTTPMVRAVV
jgi:hypothetical protein